MLGDSLSPLAIGSNKNNACLFGECVCTYTNTFLYKYRCSAVQKCCKSFFFKRAANSVGKIRRLNNKGKGKKIKNERRRAKGKGLLERERGDGNLSSPVMNKSPVDSLCARKLATRALLKWQQRRFLFIFGYIRRPWYVYNGWIDGERETRLSPCRHPHHSHAPSLGLLCKRQDGVTFPYFCFFFVYERQETLERENRHCIRSIDVFPPLLAPSSSALFYRSFQLLYAWPRTALVSPFPPRRPTDDDRGTISNANGVVTVSRIIRGKRSNRGRSLRWYANATRTEGQSCACYET